MDAFETVVAALVRREGYWVSSNFKVELNAREKTRIGIPTCPRWEFDMVAYNPAKNEVLVIECKSYLDSKGVRMAGGKLMRENRYKLFNDKRTRETVLAALQNHLLNCGMCLAAPKIVLVLAAGKIAPKSVDSIRSLFDQHEDWELWDEEWVGKRLEEWTNDGYENDSARVAMKLLTRYQRRGRFWSDGSDAKIVDGRRPRRGES